MNEREKFEQWITKDLPMISGLSNDRLFKSFKAGVEVSQPEIAALKAENERLRKDAERYQFLRERDIDAIDKGGVFAGLTPDNLVLNGAELDSAIDAAMADIHDAEANVTYAHPNSEQVIRLVLAASNAAFLLSELETVVPNKHRQWFTFARNNLRDIMAELEEQASPDKPNYLLEVAINASQESK